MQSVSSSFLSKVNAGVNTVAFGLLISWLKTYNSTATFFTIGSSSIGGSDFIKGSGGVATFFDKYNYIVETENANTITVNRTASQIPIGIMMAQADITLDNTSKRYLPDYDGIIGAYIKPGRPIKINMGFDTEVVQQFVGYTDRPKSSLVARILSLHATDAMDYLNNFESSLSAQVNITSTSLIGLLLNEAGFSSSQYNLENSLQKPIGFVNPYGQKIGKLIEQVAAAEGGLFFFDEQGIAQFWNRLHYDLNATALETHDYTTLKDVKFIDTPVINNVRVTAKPRAVMLKQPVFKLPSPITLQPGQTYVYFGQFADQDGELPVTSLDTPVYVDSATTSYYRTNVSSDGTGDNASSNISMSALTLLGTAFKISINNSSSSTVMYITDMQLYGTPAKVQSYIQREYKNQTSIDDNGINPDNQGNVIEFDNDYIQDSDTAYAYAYNLVTNNSQPRRQFSINPFPNPARQFGDVSNVLIEDSGTTYKCVTLGMQTTMELNKVIDQRLLVEARVFRSYFKIGTSSIGGVDAIAP